MKNFSIIGVGGFVAPRHLRAISENSGNLVVAVDPNDSVGILDSYFPNAQFFTEFERYDRHIDKLLRSRSDQVDFVSICSPNYLHDAHIRHALRNGANAICEKPLVLNPWNLEGLVKMEQETGGKVYNILQLRLHPSIIQLKKDATGDNKKTVQLTYIASRGQWYHRSWKGKVDKSGGIVTNIGIHFFDMLQWIYGKAINNEVHYLGNNQASGFIELEHANVSWFLSIDEKDLPEATRQGGTRTYRNITVDGKPLEFSQGFTDLHTASYTDILGGAGFGITDAAASIQLAHDIRNANTNDTDKTLHPYYLNLTQRKLG